MMLQRISPSVALLLSLVLHAVAVAPALWQIKVPAPMPLPLRVDLPQQVFEEAPARMVSTKPETEPMHEPVAVPRRPAPEDHETPKLSKGRALEKAQAALTRHLRYPPEAIARGLEGEVILLLILDASGRLTSAEIARSSGHTILDQAALTAAQRIGALPGNPKQTLLPVRFRLD